MFGKQAGLVELAQLRGGDTLLCEIGSVAVVFYINVPYMYD